MQTSFLFVCWKTLQSLQSLWAPETWRESRFSANGIRQNVLVQTNVTIEDLLVFPDSSPVIGDFFDIQIRICGHQANFGYDQKLKIYFGVVP